MKETCGNNRWQKVLECFFLVLAYSFLLYKVCTYNEYSLFFKQLSEFSIVNWLILSVIFLLMPINLLCEAIKWKFLLSPLTTRPLISAYQDVYKGIVAAFATPNRLGEFPGRTLWMPQQMQIPAITLGFIGSFVQTIIIFLLGLPTTYYLFHNISFISQPSFYLLLLALLAIIGLVVVQLSEGLKRRIGTLIHTISQLGAGHFLVICSASIVRYCIFAFQLYLMLLCCNIDISLREAVVAIPAYYFLVTFTPSISAAEPAIRGSWAILVFAAYTSETPVIAVAAILLWIINGVIPMLIGSVLKQPKQFIR